MFTLKLADINILVTSINPELTIGTPAIYQQFLTEESPDVIITVDQGELAQLQATKPYFVSTGNWTLYKQSDDWVIALSISPSVDPWLVANFDPGFGNGEIHLNIHKSRTPPIYPLAFPLDELLMINLLARNQGIELHACAVALSHLNKGLIFAGMSGVGKSTLTRLWQNHDTTTILSDDRVLLRKRNDGYKIYGTPWHGDALGVSACAVPVDHIYILRQASSNQLTPLGSVDAAAKLLARSFPTFWDASAMVSTLELLNDLSQTVPCYEFDFVPDQSAIDFILENIST